MAMVRAQIMCCAGTGCTSSKSPEIIAEFAKQLAVYGLENEVQVSPSGCQGLCAKGPVLVVWPEGVYYAHVSVADVEEIVTEHLLKGRLVERLVYNDVGGGVEVPKDVNVSLNETGFYKKQVRVALRNCGVINPENIDEYIAFDGYAALAKVLTTMTPKDVLDEVSASGLRDREPPLRAR